MHLLFLESDPSLASSIQENAQFFNFTFSIATTPEEFKTLLGQHAFDALVIVDPSQGIQGQDLVAWVRESYSKTIPLALVTSVASNAEQFAILKQQWGVNYVLAPPLEYHDLAAVLRKICQPVDSSATPASSFPIPEELKVKYENSIYDKIQRIEALFQDIRDHHKIDDLQALKKEVHKIAGSAASYGYSEVSDLCKACEIRLNDFFKTGAAQVPQDIIDELSSFTKYLRLFFQHIIPKEVSFLGRSFVEKAEKPTEKEQPREQKIPKSRVEQPTLYLVTEDLTIIKQFQDKLQQSNLEIITETDPQQALEAIKHENFVPYAIIVNQYFPIWQVHGDLLIRKFFELHPKAEVLLGMIFETDPTNLEERVKAVESRVQFLLNKPISDKVIDEIVMQVQMKLNLFKYRVLIIDDDKDITAIATQYLEEVGCEVKSLSDETKLLDVLGSFAPQVILLDLGLQTYSGWNILKTLRAEVSYHDLIIILFTAASNQSIAEKVPEGQFDDVVSKPFTKQEMQSRVMGTIERFRRMGLLKNVDYETGFPLRTFFLRNLEAFLHQNKHHNRWGVLVFLEVNHMDQLRLLLKFNELRDLNVFYANLIKRFFEQVSLKGLIDIGKFALVFADQSPSEIESRLEVLFAYAQRESAIKEREEIKLTLSAAICSFNYQKANLDEILSEIKSALKEAQDLGGNQIRIKRLTDPYETIQQKPHIVIVDDDVELVNILQFALQKEGFNVTSFYSGRTALNYFAKLQSLESNMVILLDRILPDIDGVEVLRNIRGKFPGKLKVIYLSSLSTEKDVLNGLEEGALDYVTKPFNMHILIRKLINYLRV